ncbi:MAG: prepilin-type N-terminal cleavage/methylation domain-containing protein [Candidatus Omnitrophica bacterium]|nr:prepilin-type N-terminal cleavage/methylation domain-containing protein [Candidatus Omnitrophota bacterium]
MKRNGFTFIEIIISITIFSVVIVAVYGACYTGIRMWHKNPEERPVRDIRLAFLKLEKDLKSSFFFSKAPFKGEPKEMSFPLSLYDSGSDIEKLRVIAYRVDKDESSGMEYLTKRKIIFSEYTDDLRDLGEEPKVLLSSAKDITFEYLRRPDDLYEVSTWQGSWDEDHFPEGVRISLKPDTGSEVYNKVIFLKQGTLK